MLLIKLARIAGLCLTLIAQPAISVDAVTAAPVQTTTQTNPQQLPNFKTFNSTAISSNITKGINEFNLQLTSSVQLAPSWEATIQPLAEQFSIITSNYNLLSQINRVQPTAQTTAAVQKLLPQLYQFHSAFMQNPELYQAYLKISRSADFAKLNKDQQTTIQQMLHAFKLNGTDLKPEARQRYQQIIQRLGELSNEFDNNLTNATTNWQYFIPAQDIKRLDGIPQNFVDAAKQNASKAGKDGWIFGLDQSTLVVIESFAKDRKLRQDLYAGFATIASVLSDNTPVVFETLKLRQELANLLGFRSYADYSLAEHQLPPGEYMLNFLDQLSAAVKPAAKNEFAKLSDLAKQTDAIQDLQAWDVAYYAELLKYNLYGVPQSDSRSYLPTEKVLSGLFNLASILFDVQIQALSDQNTWDPVVKVYLLKDSKNNNLGYFYLDLYVRDGKQTAPVLHPYRSRIHLKDGTDLLPICFIDTSFADPKNLNLNEAATIFYLFGQMLQYNLNAAQYPDLSSSNTIALDNRAINSQFMQQWSWQPQVLRDIARNAQGAELSLELLDRLTGAHNFDAGLALMEQVELSIFDLRLHSALKGNENKTPIQILQQLRKETSVIPVPLDDALPNRFRQIFAQNYAAGYFINVWSQVLAADAFAAFKERGLFTAAVGHKYADNFFRQGDSVNSLQLFKQFRGREPQIKFLLQEDGIG